MTEASGTDEARQVEAGEAAELDPDRTGALDDAPPPDLDRRQRNIRTTRKPMGPPLQGSQARSDADSAQDAPQVSDEQPTDPV